ncbi:MAG TPA: hypothetical protein VKA27_08625 [Sunxiuqinia sp.]|nr:hypothetical protein [Sunxiuqinia sp.]
MKKRIPISVSILMMLLMVGQVMAQDCVPYFAVKQGAVREMTSYNGKDKLIGTMTQTVKKITTSGDTTKWTIGVVSKDKKGKEVFSRDMHMSCLNGIFRMDMKNLVNDKTLESFQKMEMTMNASDLDYPSHMKVGQTLKDGTISISVSNAGVHMMTISITETNRKVDAMEKMTTPAGTFSCYKISSTIETKSMLRMVTKNIEWMAKDVGAVRTETYDKKGKLESYSVLTSFK